MHLATLPGNRHQVSDRNPCYVVGAERYRISFAFTINASQADQLEMDGLLQSEHRRTDGYGLALLESQEHGVMFVGPPAVVAGYRAACAAGREADLDVSTGACYERWPQGEHWDRIIPEITWFPDGVGMLAEFDHPSGGQVVLFEYVGDDGRKMVTYHCGHCHMAGDLGEHYSNRGPADRHWASTSARRHFRHAATSCRPLKEGLAEAVLAAVGAREMDNAAWCDVYGDCVKVREARARTAEYTS